MSLSTHVLDAVRGRPAAGVTVALHVRSGSDWAALAEAVTDADGRIADFDRELAAGVYRLTFETESVFGGDTFYPEVTIAFRVSDPAAHHHVPLLLSPFAYSTYRGS
jgi:5-hydroxyisourate hydrolase